MKYIKKTKKIPASSKIVKHWAVWLKRYREIDVCLQQQTTLEQYRDELGTLLENAGLFQKEQQFREDAKNVIGELFEMHILQRMPSLRDVINFDRNEVIIEKLNETSVRCRYSVKSGVRDILIIYNGHHTPTFRDSPHVTFAVVEYMRARMFQMSNNKKYSPP
jgi:hypothetical protein